MQDILDKFNKLSNAVKLVILVVVCTLIVFAYVFMRYVPGKTEIKNLQNRLSKLEVDLAEKKAIADNLPKFQEEVARLDEELQKQLKRLPNQSEIPKILRTISNLGKKVGLEFTTFSPGADIRRDFYAEVPLRISVIGNYHQVALFFDKLGQLDRIINVQGINLSAPRQSGGKTVVTTNATLVTYRFLEKAPTK